MKTSVHSLQDLQCVQQISIPFCNFHCLTFKSETLTLFLINQFTRCYTEVGTLCENVRYQVNFVVSAAQVTSFEGIKFPLTANYFTHHSLLARCAFHFHQHHLNDLPCIDLIVIRDLPQNYHTFYIFLMFKFEIRN